MSAADSVEVEAAIAAVRTGQLIVIPTDTVYGIATLPFEERAIARLFTVKRRPETMPPPVLAADWDQARRFADVPQWVGQFWPGALTVVLPSKVKLGWDKDTVALRVPADEKARAVLSATGPLAVTSANLSGEPPAVDIATAKEYFGSDVAAFVDGGTSELGIPSTIVDLTGPEPQLLRSGALDWAAIVCAHTSS